MEEESEAKQIKIATQKYIEKTTTIKWDERKQWRQRERERERERDRRGHVVCQQSVSVNPPVSQSAPVHHGPKPSEWTRLSAEIMY